MTDGEPNESVPAGKEDDKPVEDTKEPVSLYDKTEAIVTRQEEANKKTEELLKRQETLHANQRLAGTSGGKVDTTPPAKDTNEEYADKLKKGEVDPLGEDDISLD